MVGHLLPGCEIAGEDAADALAVAICHAHHQVGWSGLESPPYRETRRRLPPKLAGRLSARPPPESY